METSTCYPIRCFFFWVCVCVFPVVGGGGGGGGGAVWGWMLGGGGLVVRGVELKNLRDQFLFHDV